MNTLRAKIIALIVVAILVVVGLATGLTFLILERQRPDFTALTEANAAQIGLILDRAAASALPDSLAGLGFQSRAAGGIRLDRPTEDLRAALRRYALPSEAVVTWPPQSRWPVASVAVTGADKMLVVPVVMLPSPPDLPPVLIGWSLLIALGTTAVVVIAVYRLTQPLALLERSVSTIGPYGELPLLQVIGPVEVRATARAINLLSSRLKSAMESRMRLVAAAGHDLRTPMTRMRLRAEFLDDPDREKWFSDLDELDRIADSAIRLVREEITEDDGSVVRLDIVLTEVVAELREMGLDVSIGAVQPAEVRIRPLALKRALRNLVINAATHGKSATVGLECKNGMAVIEIVDRGPGIPEAMLERALEPFFRVDPARAARHGVGLGLAIAKEIIQRNGGQLTLANASAGGLRQIVELPATG